MVPGLCRPGQELLYISSIFSNRYFSIFSISNAGVSAGTTSQSRPATATAQQAVSGASSTSYNREFTLDQSEEKLVYPPSLASSTRPRPRFLAFSLRIAGQGTGDIECKIEQRRRARIWKLLAGDRAQTAAVAGRLPPGSPPRESSHSPEDAVQQPEPTDREVACAMPARVGKGHLEDAEKGTEHAKARAEGS